MFLSCSEASSASYLIFFLCSWYLESVVLLQKLLGKYRMQEEIGGI
jgi:hypothetical protein